METPASNHQPGTNNTSGLTRDVRLLELLAGDRSARSGGLSVTELAQLTGRSKSIVSRALSTLAEAGLVRRDPETRAFTVGPRVFAIASKSSEAQLVQLGRPVLRGLVRATMETAHLSILHRGNVLTLASELSPKEVRSAGWEGVTTAAWRTPSGRVLVSDWDDPSLLAWYASHGRDTAVIDAEHFGREPNPFQLHTTPPRTAQTITDAKSLLAEMHRIRVQGYSVVDGELEAGVIAASAPVYDHTGRIHAALNVSGPRERLAPHITDLGIVLNEAATALSRSLGAPSPKSRSHGQQTPIRLPGRH
ncbi:IclR family transcriptional regulator [Pseudarthrobacter sp. SSS035]|uniref:IclR family transcriptional regulator n=1 Tax=Pseudarthrobacter sp. SSS035 TaxID=2931399 RepID=UPI00200FABB9|nr:IclR family transcriptional regulator [Pseudarthrobacter sp. SSS035]